MDADVEMLLACEQSNDVSTVEGHAAVPTSIGRRGFTISFAFLVLGAAGVVALTGRSSPRASAASGVSELVGLRAKDSKAESASGNKTADAECLDPGEDCSTSKCCNNPGFACYQKNEYFATCRSSCPKGWEDPDDGKKWSCKQLGDPAPMPGAPGDGKAAQAKGDETADVDCFDPGEDCRSSKCCNNPGFACYQKNEYFATCRSSCPKGWKDPDDGEKWNCKQLGEPAQMPGVAGAGGQASTQGNATSDSKCHDAGEDCSSSKCCNDPGFACYQKAEYFASCRASCPEGLKDPDDGTEWSCKQLGEPALLPEGPGKCAWSGENCITLKCCNDEGMQCIAKDKGFASCKLEAPEDWEGTVLGHFRGDDQEVSAVGPDEEALGSRLLCVAVKSPNGRVSEDAMLARQEELGIGVFGCDVNMVLQGKIAEKSDWDSVRNIDVFIYIWGAVIEDGRFRETDWTVKSDPDAVFFPQRLKRRLEKLGAPVDQPVYVKNTEFKFGFMGSLEVFTSSTLELYSKYGDQCSDHIGHEGGEDFFFKVCFDALGVGSMTDFDIMYDKYTKTEKLILNDVSSCGSAQMASFHPYRDPEDWEQCYQTATAAEQGSETQESAGDSGGDAQDDQEAISFRLQK